METVSDISSACTAICSYLFGTFGSQKVKVQYLTPLFMYFTFSPIVRWVFN